MAEKRKEQEKTLCHGESSTPVGTAGISQRSAVPADPEARVLKTPSRAELIAESFDLLGESAANMAAPMLVEDEDAVIERIVSSFGTRASGVTAQRMRSNAIARAQRIFALSNQVQLVSEARVAHEAEVAQLRRQVREQQIALERATADSDEREKRLRDLEESNRQLQDQQALSHLLNRVGLPAQEQLLKNPSFRERFRDETPQRAFVVSIDVRRSTELMLKARRPKDFAEFVLTLTRKIRAEIIAELGIFDKFTGDGVLAFFPEFYSGSDAGYRALAAVARCHAHFERLYREHRRCFTSILKDTGLGVGVDYGDVQLVEVGGEITVVGTPVVYACRMGAAPARCTYANQPAYEQLFERYSVFDFRETELLFKHEGSMVAYEVASNGKSYEPVLPDWLMESCEAPSPSSGLEGSTP